MRFNKTPWTNLHGFNLDWVIETVKECKSLVDGIVQEVTDIFKTYVTKTEMSNNRKLSETGDFTGTWKGDTKEKINTEILNGQKLYTNVIQLINSNPQLNMSVEDGGFLASSTLPSIIDNGLITVSATEEVDGGFFIYPCKC